MTEKRASSVVKREILGAGNVHNGDSVNGHDTLAAARDLTAADRALIALLQIDGRAPFTKIARELDITEKTARRRVQDLLARDVIQITTVADPRLLGYGAFAAVALRIDMTRSTAEIASELAAISAVDYVLVTTGRYHVVVELICRDLAELTDIVNRKIVGMPGLADYEIYPYLGLYYQEPRFQTARWKPPDSKGIQQQLEPLDEIDRRILRELNADGRVPLQTVARRLDISETQVRHRVNGMLAGGSVRVLAITNPRSVGFEALAWIGVTAAPHVGKRDLAGRLAALPSVTYVAICAGRFDVLVEMVCTNQQDLLTVLDEQVTAVEGIGRTETFVCVDLHYKRLVAPAT